MGRHPHARAFFLEGFPREANQVEEFEKNVSENESSHFILNPSQLLLKNALKKDNANMFFNVKN